jgi:hypothetical protein
LAHGHDKSRDVSRANEAFGGPHVLDFKVSHTTE